MRPIHYWTGYGTLCSLDNSVTQKANHSSDKAAVTCPYCAYQISLNAARIGAAQPKHTLEAK